MDISNLTIPPNLFYSKNPSETWKPRCLSKITPFQITKEVSKKTNKTVSTGKTAVNKGKYRKKRDSGPQLGRIGKVRNAFVKKKLIKKKVNVLKEKSGNNNIITKPLTKQEEHKLQKNIKEKEEEIQKRLYIDENRIAKRKLSKISKFKFFKSKNVQGVREESSEEDDDIVPEIRDYSPTSSSNTSQVLQDNSVNSSKLIIDPEDFDEDESETKIDGTLIESLLQNLDETETDAEAPEKQTETSVFSLDSLIGTLEGTDYEEPAQEKKENKQMKLKFMGIGNNQLQIDAGQKKFGLVECKECGFSYNTNVPEDEKLHNKHHLAVITIPRFRGWSTEDAMAITEWSEQNGRVIHLPPGHKNIKSEYVIEIIDKMEMEFGSQDDHEKLHIYLTAYDSKIVGIATVKDSVTGTMDDDEKCVRLGIQRLFVRPTFRRKGIATAILKTIVILHQKGDLFDLRSDVAFSSPTDEGKKLIVSVIGSEKFFVFSS